MNFDEQLIRAKNEIKVRVLTRKLYDAIDRLNVAFADIDAAKKDLKSLEAKQLKGDEK